MAQKPIRSIVESCISERGGNVLEGQRLAAQVILEQVEQGRGENPTGAFTVERIKQVSIQDLFESLCNYDGKLDMNDAQAVREAVTAAAFPTMTSQLISSLMMPQYSYALGDIMKLVTTSPSDKPEETHLGFGATDNLELVGEAVPYSETDMNEKYVVIRNFKFGRMIAVTREAVTFDQTKRILGRAGSIGEKAGLHKHQIIAQKAIGVACTATGEAATSNFRYKGTGIANFANSHTTTDGQVNDNISTTAFGHTGMEDLELLSASIVDERGDRIMFMPRILFVPRALRIKALQLLGSEKVYDVANNAINPFKGEYTLVVSPFLDDSSSTLYYLGDFPKQMVWNEVWPLRIERDAGDFSNDTVARIKVSYMGNAGLTDYRFVLRGGT